ncbi:MAG TPA: type II toxin-antitoxin system death-on-curing family toxin [Polyangiaceae bacterium]|nr:type II toxin-antitoxin system death-on-curing family toxin [Polyangiaceae bacterium]
MRLSAVVFLDAADVERIHEEALAIGGGASGLRDRGLLESAVAVPRTSAFGDLAHGSLGRMAAALAHAIARNHPFVDGNKRAAFAAMAVFLRVNGRSIDPDLEWDDVIVAVAIGATSRDELAARIAAAMGGDEDVEANAGTED